LFKHFATSTIEPLHASSTTSTIRPINASGEKEKFCSRGIDAVGHDSHGPLHIIAQGLKEEE
jgi:hypothetical protein